MAIKTVKVKFDRHGSPGTPISGWNNTGSYNPTTVGTIFADMVDDTAANTGLSLSVVRAANTSSGSASWCTVSTLHGLPEKFWYSGHQLSSFDAAGAEGMYKVSGFLAGQAGTITLAGHQLSARTTIFLINGASNTSYVDTASSTAFPAPVSIAFTADSSGEITIQAGSSSAGSMMNGFILEYDPASAVTITSIDDMVNGQTFNVTVSDSGFTATQASFSDGITTLTVSVSGSAGSFTGTAPQLVDGDISLLVGGLTAKLTDGVTETGGQPVPYGIEYGHPDNATLVAFTPVTLDSVSPNSVSSIFRLSPAWAIGTKVIYDAARCTIDVNGEFTSSYTGSSYAWYRNPDDQIARLVIIDTVGGEIVAVTSGLSVRGLSVAGLSVPGLSVTGL